MNFYPCSLSTKMACTQRDQYAKPGKDYDADQSMSSIDPNCLIRPKRPKTRTPPPTPLHHRNHHLWMMASMLGVSLTALLTTVFWDILTKPVVLKDPQSVSLFETFAVDYEQVQEIRLHNMQKYSFNYSIHGIDRRANLSLQEYRDVYDGKW